MLSVFAVCEQLDAPVKEQVLAIAQSSLSSFEILCDAEKVAFKDNLAYVANVLGKYDFPQMMEIKSAYGIMMQSQGSFPLCAVAVLNNAIGLPRNGTPLITPKLMAQIADDMWFQQALDQELGFREKILPLRSSSGDFSVECIQRAAASKAFAVEFYNILQDQAGESEVTEAVEQKLSMAFSKHQVHRGPIIRPAGYHHYTCLLNHTKYGYFVLDSLNNYPQKFSKADFLQKLLIYHREGSVVLKVVPGVLDDQYIEPPSPPTFQFQGSIEEFWKIGFLHHEEELLILKRVDAYQKTLTVSDLMTLKPERDVNHAILDFVCDHIQSVGTSSLFVLPTDFLLTLQGGNMDPKLTRGENLSGYRYIAIPVHEPGHWWLIVLDNDKHIFGEYDSVNQDHISEALFTILAQWAKTVQLDITMYRRLSHTERQDIVLQRNSHDCGLHVIFRVLCLSAGHIETPPKAVWNTKVQDLRPVIGQFVLDIANGRGKC